MGYSQPAAAPNRTKDAHWFAAHRQLQLLRQRQTFEIFKKRLCYLMQKGVGIDGASNYAMLMSLR